MTDLALSIIVFGASGDLAKKKTYPALEHLYMMKHLPLKTQIIGYARTKMDGDADFISKLSPHLKSGRTAAEATAEAEATSDTTAGFFGLLSYFSGSYSEEEGYTLLKEKICQLTLKHLPSRHVIIFYLALPPSVFMDVASGIRKWCWFGDYASEEVVPPTTELMEHSSISLQASICSAVSLGGKAGAGIGSNVCFLPRLIVEKPFGRDLTSSNELSSFLGGLYPEHCLYRIDHYLGKEMVKNILTLRFGNLFLHRLWNRDSIDSVQIIFKEPFGLEGRGGYFDSYGMIRDVMQNHLLQIMTILAMERPSSLDGEGVRDEKVKVLKGIKECGLEDVVLGQYVAGVVAGGRSGGGECLSSNAPRSTKENRKDQVKKGYLEEDGVPEASKTETFAMAKLFIENERWEGVPFVLWCGKGLDEHKAEIRIRFKEVPSAASLFKEDIPKNELVIRVGPCEAVHMKMVVRRPGLESGSPMLSELDLSYHSKYSDLRIPDAYESLILECLKGDRSNFVRSDELYHAWRIFTPLLDRISSEGIRPFPYVYGSAGPKECDALLDGMDICL